MNPQAIPNALTAFMVLLFFANIVKVESRDKYGKRSFTIDVYAEPHPILCKYSESREQRQVWETQFYNRCLCRAASYIMQI